MSPDISAQDDRELQLVQDKKNGGHLRALFVNSKLCTSNFLTMVSQCAPRRVCPECKQELSRSAYYRHQNAPSCCPVGQQTQHPPLVPPPVENEVTVSDEVTDSPDSPDTNGGGGVDSDMECDSGTEAGEGELEVVDLAEPATPPSFFY